MIDDKVGTLKFHIVHPPGESRPIWELRQARMRDPRGYGHAMVTVPDDLAERRVALEDLVDLLEHIVHDRCRPDYITEGDRP